MNKTDVLLVNPTRVGLDSYCTPPLHLMYLKRALNDVGYDVQIVNVHERYNRRVGASDNYELFVGEKRKVEEEAITEILDWEARLIGIGGVCPSYEFSERLVQRLKAKKTTPIIIGGSLGLPLKESWLKNTQVDYLCEADGERLIVDLMRHLDSPETLRTIPGLYWRENDAWQGNPPDLPKDLDYIVPPRLEDIDYDFYMNVERKWVNLTLPQSLHLGPHEKVFPVVFTRGCIYDCAFCFHFSRKHRRHSIEYILEYIRRLRDDYGVTLLVTWDDLIMANPKWFMDLCDALAAANLGVRIFTSGGKANIVTAEMAQKMSKAGFIRMSFGIESGSQKILDEMRKKSTVEDNRRALQVTTKSGIFVHANIVLGMPGETRETLNETMAFLVRAARENGLSMKNISCSYATAYPGTDLYQWMVDHGRVKEERDYILNVKGVGNPDPVLCQVPRQELIDFVTRLAYQVNDAYFKARGQNFKRLTNMMIYNPFSRKLAAKVPKSIKDQLKKITAP
jgi:radical SAM superfamily enzyme YgiQ (UPF0313 family)